jgi:hypothetical protein
MQDSKSGNGYFTQPDGESPEAQSDATARISDADWGISGARQSTLRRFLASLLRAYRQSTLRLLVLEILCFPLRIRATAKDEFLRYGNTSQCGRWDGGIGSFDEERRYSHVCMSRIQELQASHPWAAPIDLDLALYMHRKGAIRALSTYSKRTRSTEQIQPSGPPNVG